MEKTTNIIIEKATGYLTTPIRWGRWADEFKADQGEKFNEKYEEKIVPVSECWWLDENWIG